MNILGAKEAPSNTARATPEIVDFGDEDDSFLLAATIPPLDPFTPQHHTAFLYSAPKLPKQEEEVEDCFDEDDNIESFLLEASINVESEAASEKLGIKLSKEDVKPHEEDSGTFLLDASLRVSAEMKAPKGDISDASCGDFCPVWRDAPCGGRYRPSPNLPPTSYTPVLWWDQAQGCPVLQPMLWGLVPPWHRGPTATSHGLSTNNARLEGVRDSKLYGPSLTNRRCVVVCDGFYEWLRKEGVKQPYLVYRRPEEGRPGAETIGEFVDRPELEGEEGEWQGPRPLYMAGLYSTWTGSDGRQVFSYTVLTRESSPLLAWLHHRMPCFLADSSLLSWLTCTSSQEALQLLPLPTEQDIQWHPVSRDVGNVRNQGLDLMKKAEENLQLQVPKKTPAATAGSKSLMANWLKRSSTEDKDKTGQNKKTKL